MESVQVLPPPRSDRVHIDFLADLPYDDETEDTRTTHVKLSIPSVGEALKFSKEVPLSRSNDADSAVLMLHDDSIVSANPMSNASVAAPALPRPVPPSPAPVTHSKETTPSPRVAASPAPVPLMVCWKAKSVQTMLIAMQSVNLKHSFDMCCDQQDLSESDEAEYHRCALVQKHVARGIQFELMGRRHTSRAPVVFVASGLGAQYAGMAAPLMCFPVFRKTMEQCHAALAGSGVDLLRLVADVGSQAEHLLAYADCAFVATIAVHIALIVLLAAIGIRPDMFIGHSIGEITCAYLDGKLSLEQTLRTAYYLGKASTACTGTMAAVETSAAQFATLTNTDLSVACENSVNNITIGGPTARVEQFVQSWKQAGGRATAIATANVAFHTPGMLKAATTMRKCVQQLLDPHVSAARSATWISCYDDNAPFSAEYLVQSLIRPVRFRDAMDKLPGDAVIIEIGAHNILEGVIGQNASNARAVVSTMSRKTRDKFPLLNALGTVYTRGGVDVSVNGLL